MELIGFKKMNYIEIYLPARYKCKMLKIFDGLSDRDKLCKSKFWDEYPEFKEKQGYFLDGFEKLTKGYSIYKVDGRFYNEEKKQFDDERSCVVRMLFANEDKKNNTIKDSTKQQEVDLLSIVYNFVTYFIVAELAFKFPKEKEIWFTHGTETKLNKWINR